MAYFISSIILSNIPSPMFSFTPVNYFDFSIYFYLYKCKASVTIVMLIPDSSNVFDIPIPNGAAITSKFLHHILV
jgi:hypothetical protein